MQRQLILTFLLSLVTINLAFAQNDSVTIKDTVTNDSIVKIKNPGHLYIGVDFSTPVQTLFSDKVGAQGLISYQIKPKIHAVAEFGFEKNTFKENHWDVKVDGFFGKIGVNYFFTQEATNPENGFYLGGRLAYSAYNQKIDMYPIKDIYTNQMVGEGSKEKASVSTYWVEVVIGGRVQLYKKLYADFSIHPAVYIGSKKQEDIDPLVIPSYGRNNGIFNMPLFWGLSYQLF